jgi:glycosyltransferase involved in cell wall biosynthesis
MMRKGRLRIVINAIHYFPDSPSGSDRLAFDHARFLASMGHEVWMVVQAVSDVQPEYSLQEDLHVLRYAPVSLAKLDPRLLLTHQYRSRDVLTRHLKAPVDVVHGHSLLAYDGSIGLYHRRARTCFSVHSPVGPETIAGAAGGSFAARLRAQLAARALQRIEKRCLRSSNQVTVFSEYTRSLLSSLYGSQVAAGIHVVPGWVDPDRFRIADNQRRVRSEIGWPVDRKIFFTLRRLVPRMGLERLITALRNVQAAGFPILLLIGGTGPSLNNLKTLVFNLELDKAVQFIGYVPDTTLARMYSAADAFVLPSAELECFGLTVLESLACGRPVLATPVGAIPEILGEVESGWLAEDNSTDALARLLVSFLEGKLPRHDPARLRELMLQKYSKEQVLQKLVKKTIGERI